jgi:beta-phosphoglucomutase-like phosphatase (HAD superfamily)
VPQRSHAVNRHPICSSFAAAQLGTAPDRCVVVEDSLPGIEAAVAAGMTAIGFCGGSHCDPQHGVALGARGAALVIDDMHELPTVIAKFDRERDCPF